MASLNLPEIAGHVNDATSFHVPKVLGGATPELPVVLGHQLTKYMVLEIGVGLLMCLVFFLYAAKIRGGQLPKGRFWNLIEVFLLYLRDQVIRPSIGKHDADRFVPYLWTLFFFVLFCNLFGMLPWCGSPTGSLSVTAVLAGSTFVVVNFAGMKRYGIGKYWLGLVPHLDLPPALGILLKPMLFGIELAALLIKHVVLAIRLLANMFAGHMVLAVFLAFLPMSAGMLWWYPIALGSVGMAIILSLLELFVAFLQAYIFMFLSALFIGMAVHQH
ncbi:MAG: F0F1 ATP synthase subunit A [Thermoguttaceae bacterium]